MIRVILIDDHPIFRFGVAQYLDGSGTIHVVGQADDGISGLRVAAEQKWDLAVVDLSLKALGGIELIRRLRALYPKRVVVVLSHFPASAFELRVRREGAAAFVSKTQDPEDLVEVIESCATDRRAALEVTARAQGDRRLPHESLTRRELQVLVGLVAGRSTMQLAAELDLSPSTVSNYVARIKTKLRVSTVADIIVYAMRSGLAE